MNEHATGSGSFETIFTKMKRIERVIIHRKLAVSTPERQRGQDIDGVENFMRKGI